MEDSEKESVENKAGKTRRERRKEWLANRKEEMRKKRMREEREKERGKCSNRMETVSVLFVPRSERGRLVELTHELIEKPLTEQFHPKA